MPPPILKRICWTFLHPCLAPRYAMLTTDPSHGHLRGWLMERKTTTLYRAGQRFKQSVVVYDPISGRVLRSYTQRVDRGDL